MALSNCRVKSSEISQVAAGTGISASAPVTLFAAFLLASQPASAQDGGGLFGGLFNGWGSSNQSAPRGRYNTPSPGSPYGSQYGSPYGSPYGNSSGPSYDLSNWFSGGSSRQYSSSSYRTLCVRPCDGYYFPISFSTSGAGVARDAKRCEASCSGARLFYHRNPGADVQHMVDLKGQPYSGMENAFRYRSELVKGCQCKPQPWSEAAQEEYKRRAEAEANGEPPTSVATATPETDAVQPQTEVAGWASRDEAEAARIERARRTRYRASDRAFQGHWWADRF